MMVTVSVLIVAWICFSLGQLIADWYYLPKEKKDG